MTRWWASVCALLAASLLAPPTVLALTPAYEPATFPRARARWPELDRAAQRCVGAHAGRAPFGDVMVNVTFRPGRDPLVKLTPSAGLPADVVACVRRAVVGFARDIVTDLRRNLPRREWRDHEDEEGYADVLSLGEARPLLDPNGGFVRRWRRVVEAPHQLDARRALAASLPRDLRLTGDLCLEIKSTPRVWKGLNSWIESTSQRVSLFWMADLDGQVWPEFTTSKQILGLDQAPFPHDYYLPNGEPGVVIYLSAISFSSDASTPHEPGSEPWVPVNRACLLPLGPREQERIAAMIDRRGACFAGGHTRDTLLAPHFAFPPDRRYTVVAASRRQGRPVCALDEGGGLSCCGIAGFGSAGKEVFQTVDSSKSEVCALGKGGTATCWPFGGGAARRVPGTFRSVSSGDDGVCAVELGGGIYCEHPLTTRMPPGPFVTVDARAGCGLLASGVATCWAGLSDDNGRGFGRDIVELATNGVANVHSRRACGRLRDGSIRCWGTGAEHAPPAAARYERIVLGDYDECGIRGDGTLDCWRAMKAPPAGLGPVRNASMGIPSCAVTTEGKIVCWGDDLWSSR